MKRGALTVSLALCVSPAANAGLLLPGAGAVSTSRAGTGVASTEGGEAIVLNPAGMAKSEGTTITIGAAIINYAMSFHRNGSYDNNDAATEPYEGQRYPVIENDPSPPLGIGGYQPVPVIAITSDLGDRIPGLTVGAGLYAPNAYPFRNMNKVNGTPYFVPSDNGGYEFPTTFDSAPPPSRYDIIEQEAAIILPTIAASYRVLPDLDVGGRFSAGFSELKSTLAVWGGLANFPEDIQEDSLFTLDAKDSFITTWGLGATYRPTPTIELGANYSAKISMHAEGDAMSINGPAVDIGGQPPTLYPVDDVAARCAPGGTMEKFKGCVDLEIPMNATIGGRYKFLDESGAMRGDLELNVDWQQWSSERATNYRVVVDALATSSTPDAGINLKESLVKHGLRDTFGVRLGGSWKFPAGPNTVIARGGVGYETGAAKQGWERADFDGASRLIGTVGGSYRLSNVSIDLGFGYIFQGTRTDDRNCNPELGPPITGCGPGMSVQDPEDRQGPDPTNPLVVADQQAENPVNQGTFKSHYLLFMLGMSTWF